MLSTRAWHVNCRIHGSTQPTDFNAPPLKARTVPEASHEPKRSEHPWGFPGKKTTAAMDSRWSYCLIKAASSVGIRIWGLLSVTSSRWVPSSKSKNLPNILYKQNMNMFWRCLSWIGLRGYSFNCQFLSAHGTFSWTQIPVLDALSMLKCCF